MFRCTIRYAANNATKTFADFGTREEALAFARNNVAGRSEYHVIEDLGGCSGGACAETVS